MGTLNAMEMRTRNRKRVLDFISMESVSRAQLARHTGLTRAAIGKIVEELLGEGLVVEGRPITGGVGRNSIHLKLNGEAYVTAGIVMERGRCMVGLCDFAGNVIEVQEILQSSTESAQNRLRGLGDVLQGLLKERPASLLGIGIAAPGPLDVNRGQILHAPNFGSWEGVPVTGYFKDRFGTAAVLENNANAFALAERRYILRQENISFMELLVDHGLGGGLVLNGRLFSGCLGRGTEVGHVSIRYDGPRCSCGNYGCAELYAAIPNIIKSAQALSAELACWEDIVDRAQRCQAEAVDILKREADYLTAVIVNSINTMDIQTIVLCGQITYKSQFILRLLEQGVNGRLMPEKAENLKLASSGLTVDRRVLAGSNLVLEHFFSGTL